MEILKNEVQDIFDNGWDASFVYRGETCGIFPKTFDNVLVCVGDKKYTVSSVEELLQLKVGDVSIVDILREAEIQYY